MSDASTIAGGPVWDVPNATSIIAFDNENMRQCMIRHLLCERDAHIKIVLNIEAMLADLGHPLKHPVMSRKK